MPYVPVSRGPDWMPYPSETSRDHDAGLIEQIRLDGREFTFRPQRTPAVAESTHWGCFHDNPETESLGDTFMQGLSMNPGFAASGPMIGIRLADFDVAGVGWPVAGDEIVIGGRPWRIETVEREADTDDGYADLILVSLDKQR